MNRQDFGIVNPHKGRYDNYPQPCWHPTIKVINANCRSRGMINERLAWLHQATMAGPRNVREKWAWLG